MATRTARATRNAAVVQGTPATPVSMQLPALLAGAAATVPPVAAPAAPVAAPVRPYLGKYASAAPTARKGAVALNPAHVAARYKLAPVGNAAVHSGGTTGGNSVTCMGVVALAAAHLAATGRPITGGNLVAAMALPRLNALLIATKAGAQYASAGITCPQWRMGYVRGAVSNRAAKAGAILATA